jgi:hypothetical protein
MTARKEEEDEDDGRTYHDIVMDEMTPRSVHHQPSLHFILIHILIWWDFMLWVLFICRDHGEGMDAYLRQHYQEQEEQQPQTGDGNGSVGIPIISGSGGRGGGGGHLLSGSSAPNATTTTHLSSSPVKKVQFELGGGAGGTPGQSL